jgi:hypothetical protein
MELDLRLLQSTDVLLTGHSESLANNLLAV